MGKCLLVLLLNNAGHLRKYNIAHFTCTADIG